jgi:hypothetical protein
MGRYKRHCKKHNTATITAPPPIPQKYKKYPKPKEKPKLEKHPIPMGLVGDILLAVKKKNKYPNLLCDYRLSESLLLTPDALANETAIRNRVRRTLSFDKMYYRGAMPYYHYPSDLYDSLIGRLFMMNRLLLWNDEPNYNLKLPLWELNEYYAQHYLEKKGIKPLYPNEMAFVFNFASTAFIIALVVMAICIYYFLGSIICVIFLGLMCTMSVSMVENV